MVKGVDELSFSSENAKDEIVGGSLWYGRTPRVVIIVCSHFVYIVHAESCQTEMHGFTAFSGIAIASFDVFKRHCLA